MRFMKDRMGSTRKEVLGRVFGDVGDVHGKRRLCNHFYVCQCKWGRRSGVIDGVLDLARQSGTSSVSKPHLSLEKNSSSENH